MKINIQTINNENFCLDAKGGKSCILIGANGSGKTRLSVYLSEQIPQVIQNKNNHEANINRYKDDIQNWDNKTDDEIKKKFDEYNKAEYDLHGEKINLYQLCELFLEQNYVNGKGGFLPRSLEHISGGTIGNAQITVDVDILKFADQYRKNKNAIQLYKEHNIESLREKLTKEEEDLQELGGYFLERSFRISAHRALTLNTNLSPSRLDDAKNIFENNSQKFRNSQPITGIQEDFDALITTLYSEEADIASKFTQARRSNNESREEAPPSSLSKLVIYWNEIMPHRTLKLDGLKLSTMVKKSDANVENNFYDPSEMSDGERNTLYVLGQCLLAPKNSFLIVDEPELHINKSIITKLWNYIQKQRADCFFLFVSHDIEFINSLSCDKYVVKEYQHPNKWNLFKLEDSLNIPEDIKVLIYGSRQKILFVEGKLNSLDKAVFERLYPAYKVIPVGSCENVKKFTKAFNSDDSKNIHHNQCFGIIDKDFNNTDYLEKYNIFTTPVAIIENIFLFPKIAEKISEKSYPKKQFNESEFIDKVFQYAEKHKKNYLVDRTKYMLEKEIKKYINDTKIEKMKFNDFIPKNKKDSLEKEINEVIQKRT